MTDAGQARKLFEEWATRETYAEEAFDFLFPVWMAGRESAAQPSAPLAKWISVEEKLPPNNNEYLVSEPEVGVTTADFRDGEWFTVRSFGIDSENRPLYAVTHWMELPEPPEADRVLAQQENK